MGAAAAAAEGAQHHIAGGADGLVGRGYVGIAEAQAHAAGVEQHSVSSHRTTGAAADGGARGCNQAVISLGNGRDAGCGRQGLGADAGPAHIGNRRAGEAVVSDQAADRTAGDSEAGSPARTNATGGCHVRRVVVQAQAARDERQRIPCNSTTDAAA